MTVNSPAVVAAYVVVATPSTTSTVTVCSPFISNVNVPAELTGGYPLSVGFTYALISTGTPVVVETTGSVTVVGTLFTSNVSVTGLVT